MKTLPHYTLWHTKISQTLNDNGCSRSEVKQTENVYLTWLTSLIHVVLFLDCNGVSYKKTPIHTVFDTDISQTLKDNRFSHSEVKTK